MPILPDLKEVRQQPSSGDRVSAGINEEKHLGHLWRAGVGPIQCTVIAASMAECVTGMVF